MLMHYFYGGARFRVAGTSLPHLGSYLTRVPARPAVQRVFATENLRPPLV
jgi:hypothetical protein